MIYFIVNPASRSGRGQKLWHEIEDILDKKFPHIEYSGFVSDEAGSLDHIFNTLKLIKDIEKLILVGGDGTVNEAINLLHLLDPMPPVACLPCGTSNDFIRSMGLPSDIEEGLDLSLSDAETIPIDVCKASSENFSRLFVNGLGSGYDGEIVHYTETSNLKKKLNKIGMSKLMYIYYGLKIAKTCKTFSARIEHDGKVSEYSHCYMLSVMVNPYEGGGIYFAPNAKSNDGISNIAIIQSPKRMDFVYSVLRALLKKPQKRDAYVDIQFKNAKITLSNAQIAQIDGEGLGPLKNITYESLPKYFNLIKGK